MEEYILEMRKYLPVYFQRSENHEYIDYLMEAYVENFHNNKYQFAFVCFHMMYMSYIYKTIWQAKDTDGISGLFNGNDVTEDNFFSLSIKPEKEIPHNLMPLGFHKNQTNNFASLVEKRDHCVHACGVVEFGHKQIERFICEELEHAEQIHKKCGSVLKGLYFKTLNTSWDPEDSERRQYVSSNEWVEGLVRDNALSQKDIKFLVLLEVPEFRKKSNNRRSIYIKVLHLVLLLQSQSYGVEISNESFFKLLPSLMNGIDEQTELKINEVANDNFWELRDMFSPEEKKEFNKVTGVNISGLTYEKLNYSKARYS